MAAKHQRPPIPPTPEARDNVLTVMQSTPQPVTTKSLARLLAAPHRIAVAELAPLLEEFVAAGRLYRFSLLSAGPPRYWHRDIEAIIRQASLAAVQIAPAPVTARELIPRLGLAFKITEPVLSPILNALVASRALHAIFPATSKARSRYWHHDAAEFARQLLLAQLAARGPQAEAGLKKVIKGISGELFHQVLQSALADRVVWRYPPIGKSKHGLFGSVPPSPEPYLRSLGTELAAVVAQLMEAGVSRTDLRRYLVQLIESAGVPFGPERTAGESIAPPVPPAPVDLIALIRRIEPGADRGALVGARDLRRAAQIDKPSFDQAVLELARQGKLSLHRHDYPTNLALPERDELVHDGAGTYYIGMALRQSAGTPG